MIHLINKTPEQYLMIINGHFYRNPNSEEILIHYNKYDNYKNIISLMDMINKDENYSCNIIEDYSEGVNALSVCIFPKEYKLLTN